MKARPTIALRFSITAVCLPIALSPIGPTSAQSRSGIPSMCADVARLANDNALDRAIADSGGELRADDDTGERAPANPLDVDGDGKPDRAYVADDLVFFHDQGQIVDITPDPAIDWNRDDLRSSTVQGFVVLEGATYIVWSLGDALTHLSKITPQHVNQVVCVFKQRDHPERSVLTGSDKVCEAARSRALDFVPFDKLHAVADIQRPQGSPTSRAANVDVDNDGTSDYVVQLRYSTSLGQGCEVVGLGILNDARTGFVESTSATLLAGAADTCGDVLTPFTFEGQAYLEHKRPGSRRHDSVVKIAGGQRQEVCQIGVAPVYSTLSDYDLLIRAAQQSSREPWEYAFAQHGMDAAELLLRNGHTIAEPIHGQELMSWAVWQQREDIIEWLIGHGASPNGTPTSGEPLRDALQRGLFDLAARLLEAGAQPTMYSLGELAEQMEKDSEAVEPLVLVAVARVGYVPEEIVHKAAKARLQLLDDVTGTNLPMRLDATEWHNGRGGETPWWVTAELSGSPAELRKVAGMYEHALPASTPFAMAWYGSYQRGWIVQRETESPLSDEEFLTFATGVCTYFFDVQCGPPELVNRARIWAERLKLPCDPRLAGTLDAAACSVEMYYARVSAFNKLPAVGVFPIDRTSKYGTGYMLNLGDLRDLYTAKRAKR